MLNIARFAFCALLCVTDVNSYWQPVNPSAEICLATNNVTDKITVELGTRQNPLSFAEEMPSFPGRESAFLNYLSRNLRYPDSVSTTGSLQTVIIEFTVDVDGTIADIVVKRGDGSELVDQEVIRAIQSMPKWIPGKMNGRNVAVRMRLPIRICLK
jgi:protein TonB